MFNKKIETVNDMSLKPGFGSERSMPPIYMMVERTNGKPFAQRPFKLIMNETFSRAL